MNIVIIVVVGVLWMRARGGGVAFAPFIVFLTAAGIAYIVMSLAGNRLLKSLMTRRYPLDAALWETVALAADVKTANSALRPSLRRDPVLLAVSILMLLARLGVPILAGIFAASQLIE